MNNQFKFVVGRKYSNSCGSYTVLAMRQNALIVRYDDGSTEQLNAKAQQRIIENMAREKTYQVPYPQEYGSFVLGRKYSNSCGSYTVLAMRQNALIVRYDDGGNRKHG